MGRRQLLQRICNVFGQRKHLKKNNKGRNKIIGGKRGIFDDTSNDLFLQITLEMEVSPRYKLFTQLTLLTQFKNCGES